MGIATARARRSLEVGAVLVALACGSGGESSGPIRVGVLHSLSGTMAISEKAVVDAVLMAVDEINREGGVLGRPLEAVVVDGRSDGEVFAREAERLIVEEKVDVVFGCWTSASRRSVRPILEEHDHLLFYPVQYEGLERSPNVVYTGETPNQQIVPALRWSLSNGSRRFFLVGSDYVFPHAANAIIREYLAQWRGEVVGEEYVALGSSDVEAVVKQIAEARPDVILNTINGDTNLAFYRALRAAGIGSEQIPTIGFSVAETELLALDPALLEGDYTVRSYFQSLESAANQRFVRAFQSRYGSDRVTSAPLEAAYLGVYLWSRAAEKAGATAPSSVRAAVRGMAILAPEGAVYVDANQHLWRFPAIGRVRGDGQIEVVWVSRAPVRPEPYPPQRSAEAWDRFLLGLYEGWGGRWVAPLGPR
jgi:urea transport system substrate-binding protein